MKETMFSFGNKIPHRSKNFGHLKKRQRGRDYCRSCNRETVNHQLISKQEFI